MSETKTFSRWVVYLKDTEELMSETFITFDDAKYALDKYMVKTEQEENVQNFHITCVSFEVPII